MTEEDFEKLDSELARMSEELENFDDEGIEADAEYGADAGEHAVAPEPEFSEPDRSKNRHPEAVVAAQVKVGEIENDPGQREPGNIHISEMQGGGGLPDPEPDVEVVELPSHRQASANEYTAAKSEAVDMAQPQATDVTEPEPVEMVRPQAVDMVEPEARVPEAQVFEVPAPTLGRSGRRAGRVKTRLLGFEHSDGQKSDPFQKEESAVVASQVNFPVGWMLVVDGPGFGSTFALFNGVSQIGRGDDQAIKLDFGDNCISRGNHAAVAYDAELKKFYLGHGGKANLVRLNNRPVLSTEEIKDADTVKIGETTLRFLALCGQEFSWEAKGGDEHNDAAIA
jgi:hypothetical protein